MPATSVLAFIVPRLVIQAENAVSDCLFFILSEHRKAADSFIRYLGAAGVTLPVPLEFTTQVMVHGGGGRPDMLGVSGERVFLVVEAKFDAPLTQNQPVNYAHYYLPKDGAGILLFLAPASRKEELWDALTNRCKRARILVGPPSQSENGLLSASIWGAHRLAIAPWPSLIATLLGDLCPESEPQAHADVLQLRALCNRLLSGELAGSSGLTDDQRDKRDGQLRAMVDAVVKRLVKDGYASTKHYRATPGPGYCRRYMTLSGHVNWCVESTSEYWARFGNPSSGFPIT